MGTQRRAPQRMPAVHGANGPVPHFRLQLNNPPPPPSEPAPADTPTIVPSIRRAANETRMTNKPAINKPKPKIPQVKAVYRYVLRAG